jgi:hypothetical protein
MLHKSIKDCGRLFSMKIKRAGRPFGRLCRFSQLLARLVNIRDEGCRRKAADIDENQRRLGRLTEPGGKGRTAGFRLRIPGGVKSSIPLAGKCIYPILSAPRKAPGKYSRLWKSALYFLWRERHPENPQLALRLGRGCSTRIEASGMRGEGFARASRKREI